jgi:hypothetical protein
LHRWNGFKNLKAEVSVDGAYAYDKNMQKVPEPVFVSLDFGQLTFS